MIDVRLLGPPRVAVDGASVLFDTRKAVALVAYLALSDLSPPRDLLADLLWGEGDVQHARGAPRRTLPALPPRRPPGASRHPLSPIRSRVGPGCLDTNRSTVALRRGPDVHVDVRRARDAV